MTPSDIAECVSIAQERYSGEVLDYTIFTRDAPLGKEIANECAAIASLLIAKNKAYGNSALEPLRVFSRASTDEQLRVRIDDKLSRLHRGAAAGEDVITDLIGYLVLLKISGRKARDAAPEDKGPTPPAV